MKTLETLRHQLLQGEFEFSRHAFREAVERNISETEIRQAGASAEIIEDYPDDKYSPSCLLLEFTENERLLHIQVSYSDVEGIPASVCTRCGEAIFSRETTERICRMVHGEAKPVRAVAMEVFAYA